MKLLFKIFVLFAMIGFANMATAQNCGLLDSVTYNIVDNGDGTSNYTFVGYFSTTSGGNKSVDITIYSGTYFFVTNECTPTTTSQTTKTFGPFNNITTVTDPIRVDWIGRTTNNCGGSRCGGQAGIAPLPVEFIHFDARQIDENLVSVEWMTATEINCDRFIVQRADDSNLDFKNISIVSGSGNSNSIQEYSFKDDVSEVSGKVFYRLKQIDFDEQYEYSKTISVNLEDAMSISVYPNPANDIVTVNLELVQEEESTSFDEAVVELISVDGRVLERINDFPNKRVDINTSKLISGMYFVRFSYGENQITKRIVVQH